MADVSFSFRRKRNTEILQIFVATSAPSQPPAMMTASPRGRRNCQQDSEAAINRQIRLQLCASPVHLSVSYYFARDDGAQKNFAKYFSLFTRLLRRGNRLRNAGSCRTSEAAESCFRKKPDRDDRENGLDAMERALRLESRVRQPLLELPRLAPGKSGPRPCDLAETHYPSEQVGAIRELGDPITSLRQLGAPASGVAEHLLDKHRLGYSEGQASGRRPAAEG